MPCTLAIRASESTGGPDPMIPQKGNIVSVGPANWEFGASVILPNWIVVTLSNVTYRQALAYHGQWLRTPQFEIVAHNPAQDRYRLRLKGKTPSRASRGGITKDDAQVFMDDWDATYVSNTPNAVIFDLGIKDAGFSLGFWGPDLTGLVFTEVSYDRATGKHICTADYSATAFDSNTVAHEARNRGADILDNDAGVLTFEIDRLDIKAELLRDIHEELGNQVGRTRYAITEAAVDAVIASAGVGTFTRTQFLSVLIDRADG